MLTIVAKRPMPRCYARIVRGSSVTNLARIALGFCDEIRVSMLASTRLLFAVALLGCTGEIEEDIPEGISPAQEAARKAWVISAQPVLESKCASCHGGSMPAVAWLEGSPDINAQKEDLLTYTKPLVDFSAPMT